MNKENEPKGTDYQEELKEDFPNLRRQKAEDELKAQMEVVNRIHEMMDGGAIGKLIDLSSFIKGFTTAQPGRIPETIVSKCNDALDWCDRQLDKFKESSQ
jgi:hypothetical protein